MSTTQNSGAYPGPENDRAGIKQAKCFDLRSEERCGINCRSPRTLLVTWVNLHIRCGEILYSAWQLEWGLTNFSLSVSHLSLLKDCSGMKNDCRAENNRQGVIEILALLVPGILCVTSGGSRRGNIAGEAEHSLVPSHPSAVGCPPGAWNLNKILKLLLNDSSAVTSVNAARYTSRDLVRDCYMFCN